MFLSLKKGGPAQPWFWMLLVVLVSNAFLFMFNPAISEALAQPASTTTKGLIGELGATPLAGLASTNTSVGIEVRWQTGVRELYAGFNLYRANSQSGPFVKVNSKIVTLKGGIIVPNTNVNFIDTAGQPGQWYQLEGIQYNGQSSRYAPFQAGNKKVDALPPGPVKPNSPTQVVKPRLDCTGVTTYKFLISADGIYRITYSDLQNNTCLNLSALLGSQAHLVSNGKSVQVSTNQSGALNASAYFEFYAQGNNSPYTAQTAYYLSFDGQGPPVVTANVVSNDKRSRTENPRIRRPITANVLPNTATPSIYQANYHFANYIAYNFSSADVDPFISTCVNSWYFPSNDLTFTLSGLPTGFDNNPVTLSGFVDGTSFANNIHHPSFTFNGHPVGQTYTINGLATLNFSFTFPQSYLQAGTNTLTMQVPPDNVNQSKPNNSVCLSHFDVSYVRSTVAENNTLTASLESTATNVISGFSSSNIIGYDISNPGLPQRLTLPTPQQNGATYAITLPASSGGSGLPGRARNHTYYFATGSLTACQATGCGSPNNTNITALQPFKPSSLKSAANSYDMLIISYSGFNLDSTSPAQQLGQLHNTLGQSTLVVNQEDIYDTFNYGNSDPQAIKDFLNYAHTNWAKAPKWVLLLGGASPNYRGYNNVGVATQSLLPTYFFVSNGYHDRAPSDSWFVAGADGFTPYMSIGRLPAQTLSEATAAVTNIINYVNNTDNSGNWRHNIGFVADQYGPDGSTPTPGFTNDSATIASVIPAAQLNLTITNYNSGQKGIGATAFNGGNVIINYLGHGGQEEWSGNGIFSTNDTKPVSSGGTLTNGNKRPLVLQLTCFTGEFSLNPNSLAWLLQTDPDGGAITSVAAPSWTDEAPDLDMGLSYYHSLFPAASPGVSPTIGEAMQAATAAMVTASHFDEAREYMMIGDPALKLAH